MAEQRAMTIRLDPDLAERLDLVAAVDGQPVSDVIRWAIAQHVRARRQDPAFQARLRERIAREQDMLEGGRSA